MPKIEIKQAHNTRWYVYFDGIASNRSAPRPEWLLRSYPTATIIRPPEPEPADFLSILLDR